MILDPHQPTVFYGQWFTENIPPPNKPSGWKFRFDGSDWSIVSGMFLCALGRSEHLKILKIIGDLCFCGGIANSYVRKRKAEKRIKNPHLKHVDWRCTMDGSDWAILVGFVILIFTRGYMFHLAIVGYIFLYGGILGSFVLKRSAETTVESALNVRCSQVHTIIIPPTPVHHQFPTESHRNAEDSFVRPINPQSTPSSSVPPTPSPTEKESLSDAPFGKFRKAIPQLLPPMMGIHSSVGPKVSTPLRY